MAEDALKRVDARRGIRRRAWAMLLLAAMASLVFIFASMIFNARADLTEDKIYSLSDSTKRLLSRLAEPVQIRAYITSGMPQRYGRLQQFIEDMLQAYHEAGGGLVGYEMVDPSGDANAEAALKALNIPKVRVQVVEDDQAQVKQGYLAILVEYLDKKETIPVVQGEEGFEYLLTRKIKKLTGKGRSRIGVVSDFGARGIYRLQRLQKLVGGDYELVEVTPGSEAIPEDVVSLIVPGLAEVPNEIFRYRLDQFRMQGKGVLVLAGNVEPMLSLGFQVEPVKAEALKWLADDLGVVVEPGLVFDRKGSRVNVTQRQEMFMVRSVVDYPFLPTVVDFPAESPVSRGLEAVNIPFVSPLAWKDGGDKSHQILMRSSDYSAVQVGPPYDVDPLISMDERFAGLSLRASALALVAEGRMQSAFDTPPAGTGAVHQTSTDKGRMLVIGTPAFLDDEFTNGENLVMTLNMLDWLSHDEGLIQLRSRGVTQRPLEELSSAGRTFFKGLWMFGLPILIVLLGLWRWWRLRRRSAGKKAAA